MDAAAAERGIDLLELPLDRFCNWVYHFVASRLSERNRRAWDMELSRPAAGELPPEWTEEGQAAAFMAASRETGG